MSRVRAFLDRIDDPGLPPLTLGDPRDEALLALLVHLAGIDGNVHSDEFALLQRLRADLEPGALLSWAADVGAKPLDLDAVVAATASVDERRDVLRLAARMIGMDGDVQQLEASRLGELARKLGLSSSTVRQVLDDVVASGAPVDEDKVRSALARSTWVKLAPSKGGSTLREFGEPMCRLLLDGTEVAAVFADGLAVRFDQGPAFVRWVDLRSYSRVPVAGAAFHLRSWDGREFTTTDARMRELSGLLDRILRGAR